MAKLKSTRQIDSNFDSKVALKSPISIEELPYSFVHYPNHYGTFISFSKERDSEQYFCTCSKSAIKNYFTLSNNIDSNQQLNNDFSHKNYFSNYFTNKINSEKTFFNELFQFMPNLCHRCNLIKPKYLYCVAMYGSNFKVNYGWYINQMEFRIGYNKHSYVVSLRKRHFLKLTT